MKFIKFSSLVISLNKKSSKFGVISAIISVLTLIFLIYTAVMPSEDINIKAPFKHFDKVLHFLAYAFLTFWLVQFIFHTSNLQLRIVLSFCIVMAAFVGGLTEFLQFAYKEAGRSCELGDLLADLAGILTVAIFFIIVKKKQVHPT